MRMYIAEGEEAGANEDIPDDIQEDLGCEWDAYAYNQHLATDYDPSYNYVEPAQDYAYAYSVQDYGKATAAWDARHGDFTQDSEATQEYDMMEGYGESEEINILEETACIAGAAVKEELVDFTLKAAAGNMEKCLGKWFDQTFSKEDRRAFMKQLKSRKK
jgi:hypothetical protein